ncbi:MAG: ribonuclease P protein component [Gallionella sp.]
MAELLSVHVVPRVVQDSLCSNLNSFTAAQRIPRSEGYSHCLKSLVISDKYFKLFFVPNQLQKARLGIVVAKRYMPKSVDRNLAKREIRELFRVHEIKGYSLDIVVMARNTVRGDKSECRDALSKLFNRVAIRCAES